MKSKRGAKKGNQRAKVADADRKQQRVSFRCTDDEYLHFEEAAEIQGTTLAVWLRTACKNALKL